MTNVETPTRRTRNIGRVLISETSTGYLNCTSPNRLTHPRLHQARQVAMDRPNVDEILAHPSYPSTIWKLKPTQEGKLPVGAGRGGPFNLSWEIHGTGDIKLVFVMGLGQIKAGWQTQTLKYGHEQGDKYSTLTYDNRGVGHSDKPIMRYSTSEMAKDVLELLDHVGWTAERQLNIIGVSMGGMIAQELAFVVPDRVSSLTLVSTAARLKNTVTFLENITARAQMFVPKSLDRAVTDAARSLFAGAWLDAPDDAHLPTLDTPNVLPPDSGIDAGGEEQGGYGRFSTNYERFAAQELTKRLTPGMMPKSTFTLQAIAANWHNKSPAQLKELGDKVGRERIMVVHGTDDRMITVPHGKILIEELEPGTSYIKEETGHVIMMEEREWWNEILVAHVMKAGALK